MKEETLKKFLEGMAIEYRAHLVQDYGEDVVAWFENNYRKVNPVKNWGQVIDEYEKMTE